MAFSADEDRTLERCRPGIELVMVDALARFGLTDGALPELHLSECRVDVTLVRVGDGIGYGEYREVVTSGRVVSPGTFVRAVYDGAAWHLEPLIPGVPLDGPSPERRAWAEAIVAHRLILLTDDGRRGLSWRDMQGSVEPPSS